MRRMLLLLAFAPMIAHAQKADGPITRSLYVALGGDPIDAGQRHDSPRALSVGVEQSRADSRWAFRLGADYLRRTSPYSDLRHEEFAAGLGIRYGRRSGAMRPYLMGGVGIANLRTNGYRIAGDLVFQQATISVDTTIAGTSRWNGMLTTGLGTDVRLGRLRLFTEARINLYPRVLTDKRRYGDDKASKALFIGIKL